MKKCYFSLSLGAVLVLAANSVMAQGQQPNNNVEVKNGGVYIGEVSKKVTGLSHGVEDKAVAIGKGSKVGESAVAVGFEADAHLEGAVAVGRGAKTQAYAVAMGFQANAHTQAIAMGKHSKAGGIFSLALGDEAKANGDSSLAFGRGSVASGWANAFGRDAKATGQLSTALGWKADASGLRAQAIGAQSKASGQGSISFGSNVHTTGDNSFSIGRNITNSNAQTVAIGNDIRNTAQNSVFLGNSSAYVEKGDTTGGIGKVEGNYAGVDAKGVVSVGSKGNERRIQNVAAGLLSHRSTDAVNGSQLHATNQRVEEVNKDAKAGIAAAMAFKEVPFVPGKWSYAAGAARYSSESAVSLNLGRTSANGKYAISGGISSDSRGRVGFRVGISGVFN